MNKIILSMITASLLTPIAAYAHCGSCGVGDAAHDKKMTHSHDKDNIVEIAMGNEDFSTLVAAVKAAGLVETLQGDGPFTVFAPTNAAFAALPEGTLESLLKPENKDKLVAILTYHVVPSKVKAKNVKTMQAPTVNGDTIDVVVKDGAVSVDGANVIKTDIYASNGVIHVIDAVIMPEM